MSAAADIIAAPKPLISRSSGTVFVALCFLLACLAPFGLNGYGL